MKLGPWAVTMTIIVIYLNKKVACHENPTCDRLYDSERPKHLSHSIKTKTVTSGMAIVQLHGWFRVQGIGTDALQWTRLWNQLHESVRFYLPLLYNTLSLQSYLCIYDAYFGIDLYYLFNDGHELHLRSVTVVVRRRMSIFSDDYDGLMTPGDECGPNILILVIQLRKKANKKLPGNWPGRGSKQGQLRERQHVTPDHGGGHIFWEDILPRL